MILFFFIYITPQYIHNSTESTTRAITATQHAILKENSRDSQAYDMRSEQVKEEGWRDKSKMDNKD